MLFRPRCCGGVVGLARGEARRVLGLERMAGLLDRWG